MGRNFALPSDTFTVADSVVMSMSKAMDEVPGRTRKGIAYAEGMSGYFRDGATLVEAGLAMQDSDPNLRAAGMKLYRDHENPIFGDVATVVSIDIRAFQPWHRISVLVEAPSVHIVDRLAKAADRHLESHQPKFLSDRIPEELGDSSHTNMLPSAIPKQLVEAGPKPPSTVSKNLKALEIGVGLMVGTGGAVAFVLHLKELGFVQ